VAFLQNIKSIIKSLFFFSEPAKVEEFILKENEKKEQESEKQQKLQKSVEGDQNKSKGHKGRSIKKPAVIVQDTNDAANGEQKETKKDSQNISKKLSTNLEYMKKVYNIPINSDIIIREFDIIIQNKPVPAFVIFIDGMTDRTVINQNILNPLMLLSNLDIKAVEQNIESYIRKHLLPQNQVKITDKFEDVINEVNFGGCGLFIDGSKIAFACDVKGWEHRGVERPNTELVIRGPQEGFTEVLRVNSALIRKILKDEDLIVEGIEIGKRSKTACSLLYLKDITNTSLVDEIRKRLKSIKVDYLIDSGELEQLIEDRTFLSLPQVIATERPDRVAAGLINGKVAVLVHGSPFALVLPTTLGGLISSSEDLYLRFPYVNFLKIVRIIAILITLLLPGAYIAITNFHQEMIPTDLLIAIEASREKVPFPSVVEVIIMEFAFELIREAGIRVPGPIGPTLGIIGALILGQAAVAANIVSPILIIIVAVTGIGSFAIPNFAAAFGFRISRFIYVFLGAIMGFLGITAGLFIHGIILAGSKSFGVPFLASFVPVTSGRFSYVLTRSPAWKQEKRPDYLSTKDSQKQPYISRGWKKNKK
jgi:spore germination protein KA